MNYNLDKMLFRLVEEIERIEDTKTKFGHVMRSIKSDINLGRFPSISSGLLEASLTTTVSPTSLSGLAIAGVDGGLAKKHLKSMDLILTRGISVVFRFGRGEGPDVEFIPDPFPEPIIKPVMQSLSSVELDQLASLERISTEIQVTLSLLEEFHIDIVLIDGSLVHHPRDRPSTASPVFEKYQETLALYRQLYHKVKRSRSTLVGIIKDSRSTRVVNMLGEILPHIIRKPDVFEKMQGIDYRWLLKISKDSDLLDTFLDQGERTFAFRMSYELGDNPPLPDDIKNWSSQIWITYLKTAREDSPLRIEIIGKEGVVPVSHINKTLSAILPLSYHHPEYGLPSPIVEADARARITNHEARLIIDRLLALSGLSYSLLEQRRSRNPFGG